VTDTNDTNRAIDRLRYKSIYTAGLKSTATKDDHSYSGCGLSEAAGSGAGICNYLQKRDKRTQN